MLRFGISDHLALTFKETVFDFVGTGAKAAAEPTRREVTATEIFIVLF